MSGLRIGMFARMIGYAHRVDGRGSGQQNASDEGNQSRHHPLTIGREWPLVKPGGCRCAEPGERSRAFQSNERVRVVRRDATELVIASARRVSQEPKRLHRRTG